MGKINVGRVFLGGLITGAVALAGDALLALAVPVAVRAGNFPSPHLDPPSLGNGILYALLTLLVGGPAAIWLYAAIRPRFGPGPKTATYVALWIWLILGPYMQAELAVLGFPVIFSFGLWVVMDIIILPIMILAMLAGARLYQEAEASAAAAA